MFISKPNHPQSEEQLSRMWLNMLMMVVNAIKFFVFLSFALVIFAFFGDDLVEMLKPAPIIPPDSRPAAVAEVDEFDKIEDGIHVMTGLKVAEGWEVVRGNCTACHSAKMITQTRATRDSWLQMIRWMQKNQGLWDLGANEKIILDYLAANYAPEEGGRRPNLDLQAIEWYVLN